MRALALSLLLAAATPLSADHPSTHGMLVFGESTVFLSHLPLFHTPHDYQVILEARFTPDDIYAADRKKSGSAIYTLEPESFVLPDQVQAKKSFKATLHRGHFERGGEAIAKDITVEIVRVIHFRKLVKGESRGSDYLLFGRGNETWVAHRIGAPPDFDQIARVTLDSPAKALDGTTVLTVTSKEPLTVGAKEKINLPGKRKATLLVDAIPYTESDELAK